MSLLIVHELHEARDQILRLKIKLQEFRSRELPSFVPFLDEQIRSLDEALKQAQIPDCYRVVVVGRFKVGKSKFINTLLKEQLAGVHSRPETAAISRFRYARRTRAEVELVSREDWEDLKVFHNENPENPEVKRYAQFQNFNDRPAARKDKTGKEIQREQFDLKSLEKEWVTPGGKKHEIPADNWATKTDKQNFLKAIRQFTSSQKPLHCLVNQLTIYAPIPLLQDSIELVDTPGLDDTEQFRVRRTEDIVKSADAILFLTTSGGSYSQSDKEFIIRQLRLRQIKHLQLIVTKGDETFENACRDAEENSDDPPAFEQFAEDEMARVKNEAKATLNELLQMDKVSEEDSDYYTQQLDNVPVHLISRKSHNDGDQIKDGIEGVRKGLYQILSANERHMHSKTVLNDRGKMVLDRLRQSCSERLDTLGHEFDPAKVEAELQQIQGLLYEQLKEFEGQSEKFLSLLSDAQKAFLDRVPDKLNLIGYSARDVLDDWERGDLAKHWATRRCGNWGHLPDLAARIADRVFPEVERLLNELGEQLNIFLKKMDSQVKSLQTTMKSVEAEHQLSGLEPIYLAEKLEPTFKQLQKTLDDETAQSIKVSIVIHLAMFVTEEVEERLEKARKEVTGIWGAGTTTRQSDEVGSFYQKIRDLLVEALKDHLNQHIRGFAVDIEKQAKRVAPEICQASKKTIEQRRGAMKSALEVSTAGQEEEVKTHLREMIDFLDADFPSFSVASSISDSSKSAQKSEADAKPALKEQHFEIPERATGFTYERIFRPYIDSATEICVEEPYIRQRFQVENLIRFCALAVRLQAVQSIKLVMSEDYGPSVDEVDSRLETLKRDLNSRDITFNWRRDAKLHDREVRFDNGWIVKIGRGLDIYHKPEVWNSVEATDFSLRSCRQTKVDIFRK